MQPKSLPEAAVLEPVPFGAVLEPWLQPGTVETPVAAEKLQLHTCRVRSGLMSGSPNLRSVVQEEVFGFELAGRVEIPRLMSPNPHESFDYIMLK